MPIRAVYRLDIRVHGITAPARPFSYTQHQTGRPDLTFGFAATPQGAPPRVRRPEYFPAGADLEQFTEIDTPEGHNFPLDGGWLWVEAADSFQVEPSLEEGFKADPNSHAGQLREVLEERAVGLLRPMTDLAAGVLLITSSTGVQEEWARTITYRLGNLNLRVNLELVSQEIPTQQATLSELEATAKHVAAAVLLPDLIRRKLKNALYLYMKARQERLLSIDQFLGYFVSLEAIVGLFEAALNVNRRDLLETIGRLLSEHSPGHLPAFESLRRLGESPTILDRFAAMARVVPSQDAEARIQRFRALKRIRNDVVHGGLTHFAPTTLTTHPVDDIHELAFHYLRIVTRLIGTTFIAFLATVVPPDPDSPQDGP